MWRCADVRCRERGREGDRRRSRPAREPTPGDTDLPELSVAQIEQQLNLAVDRVMTEGGIAIPYWRRWR
ncbi:hypothetical protein ACLK1U_23180 [Escherichia coli]